MPYPLFQKHTLNVGRHIYIHLNWKHLASLTNGCSFKGWRENKGESEILMQYSSTMHGVCVCVWYGTATQPLQLEGNSVYTCVHCACHQLKLSLSVSG